MQFQFASISDFFAMGGYGFYVWLAYGLSLVAMGGLIWFSAREQQRILQRVKKDLAREQRASQAVE